MTLEVLGHLNHAEAVVQEAKRLLARHGYLDDQRTVMVIGFILQDHRAQRVDAAVATER